MNKDLGYSGMTSARSIHSWDKEYHADKYIKEEVEYLHGRHIHEISDSSLEMFVKEVPAKFGWQTVYKVFHNASMGHHWLSFGHLVGIPVPIYKKALDLSIHYGTLSMNKNRVPFMYLFYKFTQIYQKNPDDEKYVPLKATKIFLEKADLWWHEICNELNVPYIPSKIHLLEYNKEYIMGRLSVNPTWEIKEYVEKLKETITIDIDAKAKKPKRYRRKAHEMPSKKEMVSAEKGLIDYDEKTEKFFFNNNKIQVFDHKVDSFLFSKYINIDKICCSCNCDCNCNCNNGNN